MVEIGYCVITNSMDTEFEATYLNIDRNSLRDKLRRFGAVLKKSDFMQRRVVFDLPSGHEIKGGWLRVRDEGDKTTLTLKVVDGDNIEGQKEVLLNIDSLEKAEQLLQLMGCKRNAYQESRRELWKVDGVEVTIDEWPFLKPFVEVEGKSKDEVVKVSEKLGFDFKKALFCSVDKIYSLEYGVSEDVVNKQTPELKFDMKNPFEKK